MTNLEFRDLRSRAGITQGQLAVRSDVDRTRLCIWENGNLELRAEELCFLERALLELISERAEQMASLLDETRQSVSA